MASKTLFRVKVSDIMDAPRAFFILDDLEKTGRKKSLEGYVPYKVLDHGIGELVVESLDKDKYAVTDLLRGYLSCQNKKQMESLL